jgi:5-methylcytosine-specific restriction endonuclease McrA
MFLVKLFGVCQDCGHPEFIRYADERVIRDHIHPADLLEDELLNGSEMLSGYDICKLFTSLNFHRNSDTWAITCSECGADISLPDTGHFRLSITRVTPEEFINIMEKQHVKKTQKTAG